MQHPLVFTCGHSTRTFEDLVDLLRSNGITLLIDVRAAPQSRFFPWFNRKYLQANLPVRYLWRGDLLGGKNSKSITQEMFWAGIEEVIRLAKHERVCVMCSEGTPFPSKWRPEGCHRWFAITPALEAKGAEVVHV